jgi:hypothetical protein
MVLRKRFEDFQIMPVLDSQMFISTLSILKGASFAMHEISPRVIILGDSGVGKTVLKGG